METLDSFISSSRPPPHPEASSKKIKDRGSVFVGYLYKASTPAEALRAHSYLKNVVHGQKKRAEHEIFAWRCMELKHGKTGLGGPEDFQVKSGCKDDGERFAGARVLKVMEAEGVMDAVVIVSRWFGGELLGPVRFDHIDNCARQVCHTFRVKEEMDEHITTLSSLDDILATLRAELSELKATRLKNEIGSASGDAQSEFVPKQRMETSNARDPNKRKDGTALSQDLPSSQPTVPSFLLSSSQSSSTSAETAGTATKAPDYKSLRESLDLSKAKRLITARENSIKSVKAALKKEKAQTMHHSLNG